VPRNHCTDPHVERSIEDIRTRAIDAGEVGTCQGVPDNQFLNLVRPIHRPRGPEETVHVRALAGRCHIANVNIQAIAKEGVMRSQRRQRIRETGKCVRQKVLRPADEGKRSD
jgi:hypothetical protein